ncbi:MAG: ABC transporter permease [Candidatus Curtissbacteria bacterium]|nr:ABC transporter permease [Candidatus Curtissbacteria bacterium]
MKSEHKIWGYVFILFLILVWEILSGANIIEKLFLPPPSKIAVSFYKLLLSSDFWIDLTSSLYRMFFGYAIAVMLAVTLGILMGSFKLLYNLLDPLIEFLRPLPSVAIIPAAILFLGIGDVMKVFIIVWASTWPILLNTIDGIRNVDPVQIDTGRVFGMNKLEITRSIKIPNAAPNIATGMRISLAIALILTITSEMVSGTNGIGLFILNSQRSFRIPEMYAGIITVAAIGFLLNLIFVKLERKLLKWNKEATRQT